jgi:cytochrome c oxidase subunit 4
MFRSAIRSARYSTKAIEGLETRWAKLPEAEQAAVAEKVYAKESGDWKAMSLAEKRASYFIAYGPYGARTPRDPAHGKRVFLWVASLTALSVGIWKYYYASCIYCLLTIVKPKIPSDSTEWQQETDRRAIEGKMNPFQGPYYEQRTKNN